MNKVILIGRLTRDAEIRVSSGEKSTTIARFTLAVAKKYKKGEADFINCLAFGKTAETIDKYTKQGHKISVEGSWQTGNYTNKEGQKVYTNECLVESIEFVENKGTQQNEQQQPGGFIPVPDGLEDELPFA